MDVANITGMGYDVNEVVAMLAERDLENPRVAE